MPRARFYAPLGIIFILQTDCIHSSTEENTRIPQLFSISELSRQLTRVNCPLIWHIRFARGLSRSGSFLIANIRSIRLIHDVMTFEAQATTVLLVFAVIWYVCLMSVSQMRANTKSLIEERLKWTVGDVFGFLL